MVTRDPLAPKRRQVVNLIIAANAARMKAMSENPFLDMNPADLERMTDRARLERDLANASEQHLDELIAHHDRSGPRLVW